MPSDSADQDTVRFVNPGAWKVLHLQVSRLRPLSLEPACQGVYICFWHATIPLGHAELLRCELPLSAAQVRNLAVGAIAPALRSYVVDGTSLLPECGESGTWLERLLKRTEPDTSRCADTSLVICTRNRPAQLERCLRSVVAMGCHPAEIIVVDNTAGDPQTRQIAESFPNVLYIIEPRPGLSRARNAGIKKSTRGLIAFTDDDIVVSRDWLGHILRPFGDADIWAANGLVLPAELKTAAQVLFENVVGGFNHGYEPRTYGPDFMTRFGWRAAPVWSISTGGNMVVRRRAFEDVGLFDERLGAGAAGCSEDSEFCYRILGAGGVCAYVPSAVVHHYHREDMQSLRRQIFLYMRGHVAALCAQFAQSRKWSNLHRIFLELPMGYAGILLQCLLSRDSAERVLLTGALGSVEGVWYWLRHAREGSVPRLDARCS